MAQGPVATNSSAQNSYSLLHLSYLPYSEGAKISYTEARAMSLDPPPLCVPSNEFCFLNQFALASGVAAVRLHFMDPPNS